MADILSGLPYGLFDTVSVPKELARPDSVPIPSCENCYLGVSQSFVLNLSLSTTHLLRPHFGILALVDQVGQEDIIEAPLHR